MKKISVFLLTLVLSLMALVGCNEEKEPTPVPPTDGPTEVVPPTDGPTEVLPSEPILGENAQKIQAEYDALCFFALLLKPPHRKIVSTC